MRNSKDRKISASDFIARIFGMIMVVLYIAIGTTIIFKANDIGQFPYHYAITFGALLIMYGLFRAYKLFRRYYSRSAGDR